MRIRLAIDIGGTFTDVVLDRGGERTSAKVLTTPSAPADAVLNGITGILEAAGLQPGDVDLILHGTTLATNAILERKGAVTALVTTEGFRDVLEIGYETRYDQYDLNIEKPKPLIPRRLRLTVPERIDVHGAVRLELDEVAVRALIAELDEAGVQSVAIGLLHSYANPDHEQRIAAIFAAERPALSLSLSSDVCPEIREYERLTTTAANAYVRPLMARYLGDLATRLEATGFHCPVLMMTSSGGLCTLKTAAELPIRLVESGPAGGAILAAGIAKDLDLARALSFDMGGTTAKICLLDGARPQMAREFEVDRSARHTKGSGLPLRIPVIEMVEIGAGGGSIARPNRMGGIQVGPDSAGSEPGPVAYGRGGTEPTVTDADVVLGRIPARGFAGGKLDLDRDAAAGALLQRIGNALGLDAVTAAVGTVEIVDETMANAARMHAAERGHATAERTLIAFGGAAPVHACRLAQKLGIGRLIVPLDAGVGSAVGFLQAPVSFERTHSLQMRLNALDVERVNALFAELRGEAVEVVAAGAPGVEPQEKRTAYMRYVGQGHEIPVDLPARALTPIDLDPLLASFEETYARLFRRFIPGADVEILSWGLSLTAPVRQSPTSTHEASTAREDVQPRTLQVVDLETSTAETVPVYDRQALRSGERIAGPALIAETHTTTHVLRGYTASLHPSGALLIEVR